MGAKPVANAMMAVQEHIEAQEVGGPSTAPSWDAPAPAPGLLAGVLGGMDLPPPLPPDELPEGARHQQPRDVRSSQVELSLVVGNEASYSASAPPPPRHSIPAPPPLAPPPLATDPLALSPLAAAMAEPEQWQELRAADGSVFYYNAETGETTWEKPAALTQARV